MSTTLSATTTSTVPAVHTINPYHYTTTTQEEIHMSQRDSLLRHHAFAEVTFRWLLSLHGVSPDEMIIKANDEMAIVRGRTLIIDLDEALETGQYTLQELVNCPTCNFPDQVAPFTGFDATPSAPIDCEWCSEQATA